MPEHKCGRHRATLSGFANPLAALFGGIVSLVVGVIVAGWPSATLQYPAPQPAAVADATAPTLQSPTPHFPSLSSTSKVTATPNHTIPPPRAPKAASKRRTANRNRATSAVAPTYATRADLADLAEARRTYTEV